MQLWQLVSSKSAGQAGKLKIQARVEADILKFVGQASGMEIPAEFLCYSFEAELLPL